MSHLSTEKSPYLLQHIDNPVDWYPWSGPAFDRARAENKLIFLSIGYSTCHWCHVMAHECFEDNDVAALLNDDYIAIKVDREERPDIDQVYMEVCQRLTGSGGWPLTIIMTPDAQPFYAATYLPKHGRHGRPGLSELLPWIAAKWEEEPAFLHDAARDIVTEMRTGRPEATASARVSLDLHTTAEQSLKQSYDRKHGGFGNAPKFPRPHDLRYLLQRYRFTGDRQCLQMVEETLHRMRCGGIYDQLGFGFHRYATDSRWLVPHFEKMLYDQAGLVQAYLDAWQITGDPLYARTTREVVDYLLRDMLSPEGAFFSAEDADSEGEEGVFYLWNKEALNALLGARADDFCLAYHVTEQGNYLDETTGKRTGSNILHLSSLHDSEDIHVGFEAERTMLFETRQKRVRPHLDDKIIAAWNGMMISSLAEAGKVFGRQDLLAHAEQVADFVLTKMTDSRGRLMRRYRDGESAIQAFAEDYAFLAKGFLDLYATVFDAKWLGLAVEGACLLRELFQDPQCGRLYDTPVDSEPLLIRPAGTFDGAMPAAGSIALEVFARLYLLTGDAEWQGAADRLIGSLAPDISRYPAGYTQALQASCWLLRPTREVVIVGRREDPATEEMLAVVRQGALLQTVAVFKPEDDPEEINRLAPFCRPMQTVDGQATAYVCQDFACRPPVIHAQDLGRLLAVPPT